MYSLSAYNKGHGIAVGSYEEQAAICPTRTPSARRMTSRSSKAALAASTWRVTALGPTWPCWHPMCGRHSQAMRPSTSPALVDAKPESLSLRPLRFTRKRATMTSIIICSIDDARFHAVSQCTRGFSRAKAAKHPHCRRSLACRRLHSRFCPFQRRAHHLFSRRHRNPLAEPGGHRDQPPGSI